MSNQMYISTKNECVIKHFKDQVNLSKPLYRKTRDLPYNSLANGFFQKMEIFTTANNNKKKLVSFPFSRGLNCLYLSKITKTATSQNFQWLKEKYLLLLRQKIHKQTSGFEIFTSPRTILLASGIGPPSNFEDC